jgi:hypothetical protein
MPHPYYKTKEEARAQKRAVKRLMNARMNEKLNCNQKFVNKAFAKNTHSLENKQQDSAFVNNKLFSLPLPRVTVKV